MYFISNFFKGFPEFEIRKNIDLKKILGVTNIFLKSRFVFGIYLCNRDRPRFFDQVGHQTTNASIADKYFFTK